MCRGFESHQGSSSFLIEVMTALDALLCFIMLMYMYVHVRTKVPDSDVVKLNIASKVHMAQP